jgi:hypothetical protein
VYDIPREIGQIDVATFCAVLPHFQNPFAALQSALSLTKETVVVTDIVWTRFLPYVVSPLPRPRMVFIPDYKNLGYPDSWWFLPPALVRNYLGVLGFGKTRTKYFFQKYRGRRRLAYAITGVRTA